MNGRPTLTILEVCNEVGVSRRTVYNWMTAGKVEYIRTAGGSVRIYEDSLYRPGNVAPPSPLTATHES
jgi:excisionase family DNA binding protein